MLTARSGHRGESSVLRDVSRNRALNERLQLCTAQEWFRNWPRLTLAIGLLISLTGSWSIFVNRTHDLPVSGFLLAVVVMFAYVLLNGLWLTASNSALLVHLESFACPPPASAARVHSHLHWSRAEASPTIGSWP